MTEDTRGSCWTVCDHAKINKIIQWYQLIVFILNKWGNIGNKIDGYQIYDFDHRFDMNYMSYHRFQMSILISDIQALCRRLSVWVQTCCCIIGQQTNVDWNTLVSNETNTDVRMYTFRIYF